MAEILAVDDEKEILAIIKKALEKSGHHVTAVTSPLEVKEEYYGRYDLILLDVMMPDMDGFTFCRKIRKLVDCPLIFLTAKVMENDLITGLSIGGDDYITKPFGIGELRARVEAHLRREHREKQNAFTISGLHFNLSAKEVCYENQKVPFTKSEYEICEFLAMNHGQVFSKERIYEAVFGFDGESDSSAITEHVKNIRSKLPVCNRKAIDTVWGIGYKWND